ncbi:hypothetical protein BN1050_01085 [Metalysinibacillus saudimassiliensis]|uniref:Yip1 domain protein n=1 Tax=Metalysinibacillus saudimassiliensis TaxID=1461583 RepID=A0A078M6R8_9BACL|nr:hypothetical protein BN1050_01085 [Metalysinibacillus saudimassiliensis]
MFYDYAFFKSLFNPSSLTTALAREAEIRGYKRRVAFVVFFTLLIFALQNIWGMGTAGLSHLFATNEANTYFVARMISFAITIVWAILFFVFHYYLIAFVLATFNELPKQWVRKVQLFVVAIFMTEKAILLAVFYSVGFTTNLNFFSLAPLVAKVTSEPIILFTLNQLSVFSVLAIIVQYKFLKRWMEQSAHKGLLAKIIAIHIVLAIIIGLMSSMPLQQWIVRGLV